MEDKKPWYLSKMVMVNILGGLAMIVAVFQPSVAAFVSEHFSAVGGGWAILNVLLRLITKKEIA